MPKATAQYLIDSGFRAEQFGETAAFAVDSPYLLRVLDDAEELVRLNVGNTAYDAVVDAASVDYLRLKRAEEQAAKAELWTRRAAFIDGSSAQAMDTTAWQERREYLRHAAEAQGAASHWIDAFLAGGDSPADSGTAGLSSGYVGTGPYDVEAAA